MLTSSTKLLLLFPALGAYNPDNNNDLYNLTNTNKCKWGFDIKLICYHPLVGNHDLDEVNLSSASCGYLDPFKFNRSWQFNFFDLKPVRNIETIFLVAVLF